MVKNFQSNPPSRLYSLLFLLIISIAFTLIILSLKDIVFAGRADEGYYLKYATYISAKGLKGFPDLFKNYLQNQENWIFPNPLRVGFAVLSCIWIKIFGNNFLNLAFLSLFSYCLFLFICFYFTRKYFDEKIALLLIILLAFSPLNMAMARRALTESTFNLFSALSLWLFFDLLKERRSFKYILFIFIYSFTILVRETAVILSLFFILYLVFYKFFFKKAVNSVDFLSVALFPAVIVGFIYINLGGGLFNIVNTIKIILTPPRTNQYAILFGSGPWFRYIIDYILLSPWVVILSIGFVFYYFSSKERDEKTVYFLLALVFIFFAFNIFTKNIRYVMILDMPMRLFSVLMLKRLIESIFPKRAFILIAIFVTMVSMFDYINFHNLFIKEGIYDPVTFLLLRAEHIIPFK